VKVVVTGVGIISAIGNNVAACLDAFEKHQSGVDGIHFLPTKHADKLSVAEVKLTNTQLAESLGLPNTLSRSILRVIKLHKKRLKIYHTIFHHHIESVSFQEPQLVEWIKLKTSLMNMLMM
jgi:hypothetical protein